MCPKLASSTVPIYIAENFEDYQDLEPDPQKLEKTGSDPHKKESGRQHYLSTLILLPYTVIPCRLDAAGGDLPLRHEPLPGEREETAGAGRGRGRADGRQ